MKKDFDPRNQNFESKMFVKYYPPAAETIDIRYYQCLFDVYERGQ